MPNNTPNQNTNPYDNIKWGVFIHGMDNAYPVRSFQEAIVKSQLFNQITMHDLIPRSENKPHAPILFAQIFIWDKTLGEHDPENTDWSEILSKPESLYIATLSGHQIKMMMDIIWPDPHMEDQAESKLDIFYLEDSFTNKETGEEFPAGYYVSDNEYPEEGVDHIPELPSKSDHNVE